jgi:acetoin utilization protein AcuB
MSKMMRVEQVMTAKVTVANLHNKFWQVMEFFQLFKIHHLPVIDGESIIGIISVHDVLHFMHERLLNGDSLTLAQLDADFSIGKIMTPNPVTISPEATLLEALELFDEGKFRALPVAEDGQLRGIITYKDLVRVYSWEKHT